MTSSAEKYALEFSQAILDGDTVRGDLWDWMAYHDDLMHLTEEELERVFIEVSHVVSSKIILTLKEK